ncbi:hypothetical protein HDU83_003752 [Entophlyctis luteolus]|nr:hypothetical protein HDU83_003752 [Entophlyctis luteolus]
MAMPRRWIRLLALVAVLSVLLVFVVVLSPILASTSPPRETYPTHRRVLPNNKKHAKYGIKAPAKPAVNSSIPPVFLSFSQEISISADDENLVVFGNREDKTELDRLRLLYAEKEKDFPDVDVVSALARFSSWDTGRFLIIPPSHFDTLQPIKGLHWFNASFFLNTAEVDDKYFEECGRDKKLDNRFADRRFCATIKGKMPVVHHDLRVVRESLLGILSAWSEFAAEKNIIWWISHGEMIGWYWNGKLLPWDSDLDIQMSTRQLIQLVAYNQSILQNRFLLDVNPNFAARTPQRINTIDARVVDMHSGYLMDITALTKVLKSDDRVFCKSPHPYNLNDLLPLVETKLDGITVWRPRAVMAIIREEYKSALTQKLFNAYGKGVYAWNKMRNEWVARRSAGHPTTKKEESELKFVLGIGFLFA